MYVDDSRVPPLLQVPSVSATSTHLGCSNARKTAVDAAVPWRVRDAALLLALGLGALLLSLLAVQGFYRLQGTPADQGKAHGR